MAFRPGTFPPAMRGNALANTGIAKTPLHLLAHKNVKKEVAEVATLRVTACRPIAGISDVRVCHPHCGEVCFVLTFLSRQDCDKFCAGPQVDGERQQSRLPSSFSPVLAAGS